MLAEQPLVTCRKDATPLTAAECAALNVQLPAWAVVNDTGIAQLERHFTFRNFTDALRFANAVGALADAADHHPQLLVEWGGCTVRWWTHVIRGLHRNDFVMAARCDQAYLQQQVAGDLT